MSREKDPAPRSGWPLLWTMVGLGAFAAASTSGCADDEPTTSAPSTLCQASDQRLVRLTIHALLGRRPYGQAEVMAYVDLVRSVRTNSGDEEARRVLVRALSKDPDFRARWSNFFMDALQVTRAQLVLDEKYSNIEIPSCYGTTSEYQADGGELASFVRDNFPSASSPPKSSFDLGDLLGSAIELDDISPIYRAHLFHFLLFPLPGANVAPEDLERARRHDAGEAFESVFINRNPDCLPCHNSDFSVTASSNVEESRFFSLPYSVEKGVFGSSDGSGHDTLAYRSVFRFDGVVDGGNRPWGLNPSRCGTFGIPTNADPLGVDAHFASVKSTPEQPLLGTHASVWAVENSLRRGFASLASNPPEEEADLSEDESFAHLVVQNMVDQVWDTMVGHRLTIGTRFPRTSVQRDTLAALTEVAIGSNYSLLAILEEVVVQPTFAPAAAEDDCWEGNYEIPPVYNPWSIDDPDETVRNNGVGDRVSHAAGRDLLVSLHRAMDWPGPPEFPVGAQEDVQVGLGVRMSRSEPGFKGLDFIAKLVFEREYGDCAKRGDEDFITKLVDAAEGDANLEAAVVSLKDRLLGEPQINSDEERGALEAVAQLSLSSTDHEAWEAPLRRICGALIQSPQFLVAGWTAPDAGALPELLPVPYDQGSQCKKVAAQANDAGVKASCTSGLRVSVP